MSTNNGYESVFAIVFAVNALTKAKPTTANIAKSYTNSLINVTNCSLLPPLF